MNSSSLPIPPDSWSNFREEQLRRWSLEWDFEQTLDDDDEVPPTESVATGDLLRDAALSLVRAFDSGLESGEIRLLGPGLLPREDRPVYVAVLQSVAENRYLIAPFSRFSLPAVPGEWSTGLESPVLRVLCLWNARVVPGDLLAESWRVGELGDERHVQALRVRTAELDASALPPEIAAAIGPPLWRDFHDVREDYLWEERARFKSLGVADDLKAAPFGWKRALQGLALAARTGGHTGTTACIVYPRNRDALWLDASRNSKLDLVGGQKEVPVIVRDWSASPPLLRWDLRSIGIDAAFVGSFDLFDRATRTLIGYGTVRDLVADLDPAGSKKPLVHRLPDHEQILVVYLDRDSSVNR